jgi:hypothetical protein
MVEKKYSMNENFLPCYKLRRSFFLYLFSITIFELFSAYCNLFA